MCEFSNSSEASAEELFENSHIWPSVVSLKIYEAKPNLFLPKFSKKSSLYKDIYNLYSEYMKNLVMGIGNFKNVQAIAIHIPFYEYLIYHTFNISLY